MSRALLALAVGVGLAASASAQRPVQFDVTIGVSTVDGTPSPSIAAAVTAWPSRVGFTVFGDCAAQVRFLESSSQSAGAVGVLAALAVPAAEALVTLAFGPSLSREDERPSTLEEPRGWLPGATGRAQLAVPAGQTVGLALGVTGTASERGIRPSYTVGLTLRLSD